MAYRYRPEDWLRPPKEWGEDQLVHGLIRTLNDAILDASEAITALEMHGPSSPRVADHVARLRQRVDGALTLLRAATSRSEEIVHE
jgi:hypothetical protein